MKITMNDTFKVWISIPDVCRCCLSGKGTFNMTNHYETKQGDILLDTLQNFLQMTLSMGDGYSEMICSICAESLENVRKFHNQVKIAEEFYKQYWIEQQDNKLERDGYTNSPSYIDGFEDNEESLLKNNKQIGNNNSLLNSDDSDTPIASLISKEKHILHGYENDKQTGVSKLAKLTKQLSERKRVTITCETVLTETTACPFRHHKSWFQCFFCFKEFMDFNLLRDHTSNTHGNIEEELKKIKRYPRSIQIDISNLECRQCQMKLPDVESMRIHFVDKHKKLIYKECIADYKVDSSPYSCHICKKEFHVFRTLTTHLNEHYANCICDVCGKSFLNSKRLKVHKRTHENGVYPCNQCGKVLRTKTSKANHMESAHCKRVIKCHICEKPMKHYNDRIKHMSEIHNITHSFKCPFCERVYNIKHYLATHIRQTHGSKNKKCSECSMAFITNHGLKKHMLKHSGERPFSCSVCMKSYTRSYTLREHMKEHDRSDC